MFARKGIRDIVRDGKKTIRVKLAAKRKGTDNIAIGLMLGLALAPLAATFMARAKTAP